MNAPADDSPHVIVLAGPNGAGKSTAAPHLLRGRLGVREFVNADVIAAGLSAFAPEAAALEAGRIMLVRLKQLASLRCNFAFETTLATRTLAPWLRELIGRGYRFDLVFVSLPSPDVAVSRVSTRILLGGHSVSEETIRRRFARGIDNFWQLYSPIASTWRVYGNSSAGRPSLFASRSGKRVRVYDKSEWQRFLQLSNHEEGQ